MSFLLKLLSVINDTLFLDNTFTSENLKYNNKTFVFDYNNLLFFPNNISYPNFNNTIQID